VYRTRFPGHAGAPCGAPEVGVEACGAGVERAAESVLFDQPLGIVAGDEVADGIADLVDGLEDAAMDDLLFQRPEQPLDDAVGLGFSDEGVARCDAPEADLVLEVIGHEVAAPTPRRKRRGGPGVVMAQRQAIMPLGVV
jgi:hypothetical protein